MSQKKRLRAYPIKLEKEINQAVDGFAEPATACAGVALDASYTHMYAPGTRRHIHNARQAGATMEEIMEVLKLCVVQGVQACNLGVPILAEELACKS